MFDLKVHTLPLTIPTRWKLREAAESGNRVLTPPPQGKAKKNAWQKVVDEGVTPDQAKERYVELVEKLKAAYGFDENKVPEAVGA